MTPVRPGARIGVTGATGFVGSVLVAYLVASGYEVVGISETKQPPIGMREMLSSYHSADLTRDSPDFGPIDGLVHLAGLAAVGPSFDRPQEYINSNSAIATNIFEHALRERWQGRIIVVSSGAVYANSVNSSKLSEESPTIASSPYVVSKLLVERQTEYYRLRGIDALVVRPFNHIGPGQRSGFIVPDLSAKVMAWRPNTTLAVGNLDSARDYTDVRDIVRAYKLLLELPEPRFDTYNVCSGTSQTGWEVLRVISSLVGIPPPPTTTTIHRIMDPSVIIGDAGRLTRETNWEPSISFEKSVADYLADH